MAGLAVVACQAEQKAMRAGSARGAGDQGRPTPKQIRGGASYQTTFGALPGSLEQLEPWPRP